MSPSDSNYIEGTFTYHAPDEKQVQRYNHLRKKAKGLAQNIMDYCPPSSERTLALRKLQEAIMWANASIAINE